MRYIGQKELKEMIVFSYEKIKENRKEIDRINVFPIPDKDTGNNISITLLGIKEAINDKDFYSIEEFSRTVLNGALNNAQGNVGVIYTGFLSGFFSVLNKNPLGSKELALGFKVGAEKARESIQNPKEGTILDVIDAASNVFDKYSEKGDIIDLLEIAVQKANEALLATRGKMEIFKEANVVDAGGLAFLTILQSYLEVLGGKKNSKDLGENIGYSSKSNQSLQTLSQRYEVVALIENKNFINKQNIKSVQDKLKGLGDSLDIVQIKDKIKVHIHTNEPDKVKKIINNLGETKSLKIEDMKKEIERETPREKPSIGIVTEDVSCFPSRFLEKYQIDLVEIGYTWPDEKNLPGKNIYQKMREGEKRGIKTFPKTSQPSPQAYLNVFREQLKIFDKILCITLSSGLSGCYNSALQAREMSGCPERIFVFDSFTAAAGQAFLAIRAREIFQQGLEFKEAIEQLKKEIKRVHLYVIFEDPKWIKSIGRMNSSQAQWVRGMRKIGLYPLIELKEGKIDKGGIVIARTMEKALFKKVWNETKKIRKQGRKIKTIIGHADNFESAERLEKILNEKIGTENLFTTLGSPVVCAAAGPGTLFVGWTDLFN